MTPLSKHQRILCWNVCSILNENKLNNFVHLLEDMDINIACVSETWFDAASGKFTSLLKESGFEINHAYRDDRRGGGTAIIYDDTLKIKKGEASTSKFSSFEYCSVYFNSSER